MFERLAGAGACADCTADGFRVRSYPHRARARHALRRPGLRDCRRLPEQPLQAADLGAAHDLRRAAQEHVRPHGARGAGRDRLLPRARDRSCAAGEHAEISQPAGTALEDALRETRTRALRRRRCRLPGLSARADRCRVDASTGPAILDQLDCTTVICPGQLGARGRVEEHPDHRGTARWRRTAVDAYRRSRSRSGEGEPLRHRAGDADLAVPHRLLHHRAGVAGRVLRADERQGRGGGAARRAAAAHRRVSGLHRRGDRGVSTTASPKATPSSSTIPTRAAARMRPTSPSSRRCSSAATLFGFCGSIAHKSDIGGPVPGSCSGQAREIFNEGLHLPAVRYQRGYRPNTDLERLIAANSRTPELVLGDIRGQLGADRLGEKRLQRAHRQARRGRIRSPASSGLLEIVRDEAQGRDRGMDGRTVRGGALRRRRRHRSREAGAHSRRGGEERRRASISISAARPTRPGGPPISARRWSRPPAPTR